MITIKQTKSGVWIASMSGTKIVGKGDSSVEAHCDLLEKMENFTFVPTPPRIPAIQVLSDPNTHVVELSVGSEIIALGCPSEARGLAAIIMRAAQYENELAEEEASHA